MSRRINVATIGKSDGLNSLLLMAAVASSLKRAVPSTINEDGVSLGATITDQPAEADPKGRSGLSKPEQYYQDMGYIAPRNRYGDATLYGTVLKLLTRRDIQKKTKAVVKALGLRLSDVYLDEYYAGSDTDPLKSFVIYVRKEAHFNKVVGKREVVSNSQFKVVGFSNQIEIALTTNTPTLATDKDGFTYLLKWEHEQ